MSTARPSALFAFVLSLIVPTNASAQVTIEVDQPAYEVTQLLSVKISGPPGAPTYLLVDGLPGPKVFSIGTRLTAGPMLTLPALEATPQPFLAATPVP